MFIVVLCSLVALFLTFLESRKILRNGMGFGFTLVTFLGCIHYNYGNDYMAYYDIYKSIVSVNFNLSDILAGEVYKEPGWALLCYFFKPLGGFFVMVAALNIVQNIIVYRVIKSNVKQTWWPLAVFVYLFSTSFYLLNFSMMRQGLVICLFLGTWMLIKEKKNLKSLLILFLCSTIHKSALVLLPFAFWGMVPIRKGRGAVIIFVILYFFIWFSGTFMNDVMGLFLSFEEFEEYGKAYGDYESENTYRLGFVLNMIPCVLSLLYMMSQRQDCTHEDKLVVALSIISFIIAPFSEIVPLVGRIGIYFSVFQIIAAPKIYSYIKNNIIALGLLSIYCFMILYGYIQFFNSPVYHKAYSDFHTVFSLIF